MTRSIDLPLGLGRVTPLTAEGVADLIIERSSSENLTPLILGNLNLHALHIRETNPSAKAFIDSADVTLIDGAPVLVLASLAQRRALPPDYRIGSTDWLQVLMARQPSLSVTAIGGRPSTARGAQQWAQRIAPGVTWHAFDGYGAHVSEPTRDLMQAIAKSDLILVGLGMPLQEEWIGQHRTIFGDCVVANVGGCLDYFAGEQKLAPRWVGKIGMEWAFRLASSPTRLAGRYLIEPFKLAWYVTRRTIDRRSSNG